MTNSSLKTDTSRQVVPSSEREPSFTSNHRDAELQANRNPQGSHALSDLLEQIDKEVGKSLTAEGAALLKQKLQTQGQKDFSITIEQGLKALAIAKAANDPEYIAKALTWGGVALMEKAPNREAFIAYARERYPIDYSPEYRQELDAAAAQYGPAFPDRWKQVVPDQYEFMIDKYSRMFNVNPNLVVAIMKNESNFDPRSVSGVGAKGLMQVMPDTAAGIERSFRKKGIAIPGDPIERNIAFGIYYLREMSDMFHGDIAATIRAYNAGPGSEQSGASRRYRETRNYLAKVTSTLQSLEG